MRQPLTRRDCEHGPRPCPWVRCRYHLEGSESCALDVADAGALEPERIAELLGCSAINVRVTVWHALKKLRRALCAEEVHHG